MFARSFGWRTASALGAAAAVLALAVPASASTGTTEISPEQAGYTATGAQFRSVTASVFLRNPAQYAGEVASFGDSVQLWSSGLVAVLGATASTSGSEYVPYVKIFDASSHQLVASDPAASWCDEDDNCLPAIGTFAAGDTVLFTVTYDPKAGFLNFSAIDRTYPDWGLVAGYTTGPGESFTQARIGTEFGPDPWTAPSSYKPPVNPAKIAVYTGVQLTSSSGHTATLSSWWVHHKLLANTGQQSGSDWVAVPTSLSSGGASFQTWFVPRSEQGLDQPVRP